MTETLSKHSKFSVKMTGCPELTGAYFQFVKKENRKIGKKPDFDLAHTETTTYQYQDVILQEHVDLKTGNTIWRSMFTKDFSSWKRNGLALPTPPHLSISQNDGIIKKITQLDFEDPAMQDLFNQTITSLNQLRVKFPKQENKYRQLENVLETIFQDKDANSNSDTVGHLKGGNVVMIAEDSMEGRLILTVGEIGTYVEKNGSKRLILKNSAIQITYAHFLSNEQRLEQHVSGILKATVKPVFLIDDQLGKEERRFIELKSEELARLSLASAGMTTSNSSF